MNPNNSIKFLQTLNSKYTGPTILNLAKTPEEEAAEAEAARVAEEAAAAEAARIAEEEEAARIAAEEGEDPLKTPNPFAEGSSEHSAFENQRAKFNAKLEKETARVRKEAETEAASKIGEIIEQKMKVFTPAPAAAAAEEKPVIPAAKATAEDVEVILDAMKQIGFDPAEAVKEKRRQEVNAALTQLAKDYPGQKFDGLDLVNHANETKISMNQNLTVYQMLELSLLSKAKETLKTGTAPVVPAPVKKEPVPIEKGAPKDEPKKVEKKRSFADWKNDILKKRVK